MMATTGPPSAPHRAAPRLFLARTYTTLAVLSGAAMLYGSVVPLTLTRVSWDAALALFASLPLTGLRVSSDGAANILLSMPLAFCAAAAFGLWWPGIRGVVASVFFVAVVLPAFSTVIEFLQIFVVGRTASLNDVLAQAIGGIGGAALRWSFADVSDQWLGIVAAHSRANRRARLLAIYVPALLFLDLIPFNVTISPADLWHKYRAGRILLVPFSMPYDSFLSFFWDTAAVFIRAAPLGALLMLDRRPTRRASLSALAIGAAIMSGLELAQVLIWTRYADATDVIVGWTGVAAGVFLAPRILPRALDDQPSRTGINWTAAAAALCWACVLAAFEWNPFEFVRDPGVVRANLTRFLEVPFTGFYGSDPMAALGDAVSKVLLAAPLGLFAEFMFRRGAARLGPRLRALLSFAPFLVFFCGLELGQAFIAGRYPSITDALILTTAAAGGCLVAATGRGLGRAQHDATDVSSVSAYSRGMRAPARVKASASQAEGPSRVRSREKSA